MYLLPLAPTEMCTKTSSSAGSDLSCLICFGMDSSIKCCAVSLRRGQYHCNNLWLLLSHILPSAASFTCISSASLCSCPQYLMSCLEICWFQFQLKALQARATSSDIEYLTNQIWQQLFLNGGAGVSDLQ